MQRDWRPCLLGCTASTQDFAYSMHILFCLLNIHIGPQFSIRANVDMFYFSEAADDHHM